MLFTVCYARKTGTNYRRFLVRDKDLLIKLDEEKEIYFSKRGGCSLCYEVLEAGEEEYLLFSVTGEKKKVVDLVEKRGGLKKEISRKRLVRIEELCGNSGGGTKLGRFGRRHLRLMSAEPAKDVYKQLRR